MQRKKSAAHRSPWDTARILLACGIAVGLGSVTTLAQWVTGASHSPGSIQAGQLDVLVDGQLANINNIDGTHVEASWAIDSLVTGETVSLSLTIKNGGASTMPLDIRMDNYVTNVGLAPAMQIHMQENGTPTTQVPFTSPPPTMYRQAACQNGTAVDGTGQSPGAGASAPSHLITAKKRLAVGQSVTYCLRILMRSGATYYSQTQNLAQSTTFVLVVRGTQVGAP